MNRRSGKALSLPLLARDLAWKRSVESQDSNNTQLFVDLGRVQETCTICGSDANVLFAVRGVQYRECTTCRHLFAGLMPTAEYLDALYAEGLSTQSVAYVDVDEELQAQRVQSIAEPKMHFIDEIIGHRSSALWIDIGSGVGDLLYAASAVGYRCIGIEADPVQASIARRRGITTVEALVAPGRSVPTEVSEATVVSLLNVVEHFPDPYATLQTLTEPLPTGSYLAIEVPRHPSLSSVLNAAAIGPAYRHAYPPEHLNLFSDESMDSLMLRLGFEVAARWTFGSDALEAFTSIGSCLGWTDGFTAQADGIEALQSAVDSAGLSDVMLVVSRKTSQDRTNALSS